MFACCEYMVGVAIAGVCFRLLIASLLVWDVDCVLDCGLPLCFGYG